MVSSKALRNTRHPFFPDSDKIKIVTEEIPNVQWYVKTGKTQDRWFVLAAVSQDIHHTSLFSYD